MKFGLNSKPALIEFFNDPLYHILGLMAALSLLYPLGSLTLFLFFDNLLPLMEDRTFIFESLPVEGSLDNVALSIKSLDWAYKDALILAGQTPKNVKIHRVLIEVPANGGGDGF